MIEVSSSGRLFKKLHTCELLDLQQKYHDNYMQLYSYKCIYLSLHVVVVKILLFNTGMIYLWAAIDLPVRETSTLLRFPLYAKAVPIQHESVTCPCRLLPGLFAFRGLRVFT